MPRRWLTIAYLSILLLRAQTPADRLTFDVASIKPSDPDQKGGWVYLLPGRLEVVNSQLIFIIQDIYGVRDFQIVDAPKWIVDWNTSRFHIQGKAEGVTDKAKIRLMAQHLLEDRFQLKVHRETRDLQVYMLTQSKNGPKVEVTPDDGKPRGTGGIESVAPGFIRGKNITMDYFIYTLSRYADRPVVDGTNYKQAFNFSLQWADVNSGNAEEGRQALVTAIQEQMGFKLVLQKAPTEVLVIDHVERPTAN